MITNKLTSLFFRGVTRCNYGVTIWCNHTSYCSKRLPLFSNVYGFTGHTYFLNFHRKISKHYFFYEKTFSRCNCCNFSLSFLFFIVIDRKIMVTLFGYVWLHQVRKGTPSQNTPLADFGTLRHALDAVTTQNATLGSWLIWKILSESRAFRSSGVSCELLFYCFSSVGSWGELKPVIRGISMLTFKAIAKLCITTKNSVLCHVSSYQVIKGIFKLIWGAFGSLSGEFWGLSGEFWGLSGELSSLIWGAL